MAGGSTSTKMINEEQLSFWILLLIFSLLSILKTRRNHRENQLKATQPTPAKPETVSLKANSISSDEINSQDERQPANDFQLNDLKSLHKPGVYTIGTDFKSLVHPTDSSLKWASPMSGDTEFRLTADCQPDVKPIKFGKSLINHSITFNSSFLIVGCLSESYYYGLKMLPNIAAVMLGYIYALLIIYPFMYSFDLKSPYDYLKRRYGDRNCVKLSCLCLALFYYFSFASLYLWGCAAIVNLLIPDVVSLGVANIYLGLYSVSGCFLGGYIQSTKTNAAQFLAVFFGILSAMYLSLKSPENLNGESLSQAVVRFWRMLEKENERKIVFDTDVNLTTRYTILNQLVSLPLPWCSKLGIFLPNYLRFKSIGNKKKAKLLFISKIPVTIFFNAILVLSGSIFCYLYFYSECDPVRSGLVHNKNQIGILWLHSVLVDSHLPAVSGLIFASIVYYALVQHSISMSTIGRTLYDEIIGPYFVNKLNRVQDGFKQKIKMFAPVVIALASIPYANLFQYSKNTMLSLFFVFNNSMNSPILGLFLLSMFNPYANHVGATSAFLLNISINFWMAIGTLVLSSGKNQELETGTIVCEPTEYSTNTTLNENSTTSSISFVYSVAPIWYCLFSVLFNLIFGSVFSMTYALLKTGRIDLDWNFRNERKKYLFLYRRKHYF